jgi:hypothetical protein
MYCMGGTFHNALEEGGGHSGTGSDIHVSMKGREHSVVYLGGVGRWGGTF